METSEVLFGVLFLFDLCLFESLKSNHHTAFCRDGSASSYTASAGPCRVWIAVFVIANKRMWDMWRQKQEFLEIQKNWLQNYPHYHLTCTWWLQTWASGHYTWRRFSEITARGFEALRPQQAGVAQHCCYVLTQKWYFSCVNTIIQICAALPLPLVVSEWKRYQWVNLWEWSDGRLTRACRSLWWFPAPHP